MNFSVVHDPSDRELAQVQATDSSNPFASVAYAAARRVVGARVVLFAEGSVNAIGYLNGHAISRSLEIPSAPAQVGATTFWDGVHAFCRRHRVAEVDIGSFGARAVVLPSWPGRARLHERTEWILQLTSTDASRFSSNHRRNISRALRLGVTTTSTTDPAVADVHVRLMAASMQRRSLRGETVPMISPRDTRYERALLVTGAGRVYQALHEGNVVSSLLVLNALDGAYYQSAGTTPEGMEMGASTLLVSAIIRTLAADGLTVFNLGGAGPESEGLRRFKSGFGAHPVTLAAGVYQTASPMHRKLRAAVRLLRNPAARHNRESKSRDVTPDSTDR